LTYVHDKISLTKKNSKKAKQALGVRFAEIVQKFEPPSRLSSSNSSPQINRLGTTLNEHDSYSNYNNNENFTYEITNDNQLTSCNTNTATTKTTKYHLTPGGPKMKMRRSMSVNDMNKLTLTTSQLDDDSNEHEYSYQGIHHHNHHHSNEYDDEEISSISKLAINVTYDKSLNSSQESQEKSHVTVAATHSSPIIRPSSSSSSLSLPRMPLELDQINRSLKETLDKLLTKEPETKRLRESILNTRKDKRELFAMLNENYTKCVAASSGGVSEREEEEEEEEEDMVGKGGIEAASTSDALEFLELSESLQVCLEFYKKNLFVHK
jgi:hypothetical protein